MSEREGGEGGVAMDVDEASVSPVVGENTSPALPEASMEASAGDSDKVVEEGETTNRLPTLDDVEPPKGEVPDPSQQLSLCMDPLRAPLVPNTDFFVIPARWLRGWQNYAQGNVHSPPPMIDTTPLIDKITPDIILVKKELNSSVDYEIIPHVVWNYFTNWYGFKGPEVRRTAYEGQPRQVSVPVHPLTMPLTLFKYPNNVTTATGPASASHGVKTEYEKFYAFAIEKAGAVKEKIAKKLCVPAESLRLWDFYSSSQLVLMDDKKTLGELNIVENNAVLVEYEHPLGKKIPF